MIQPGSRGRAWFERKKTNKNARNVLRANDLLELRRDSCKCKKCRKQVGRWAVEETVNPERKVMFTEALSRRKRVRRPSKRGQKFIENVSSGMSDKAAALAAGYAPSVAESTRRKLWSQPSIQAQFLKIVHTVLPPKRVMKILGELLDGKSTSTQLKREQATDVTGKPLVDQNGKPQWHVVSVTQTETIDRNVQLKALEMVVDHGGLVPFSIRAPAISSVSLEEVLLRAEREYEKHAEMMTPTWRKERAKRLDSGHARAAEDNLPEAESEPVNCCDAHGTPRCVHSRYPMCETCEECEGAGLARANA